MSSRLQKPKSMRRVNGAQNLNRPTRKSPSAHSVTLVGFDNLPISETELQIFETYLPEITGRLSGARNDAPGRENAKPKDAKNHHPDDDRINGK